MRRLLSTTLNPFRPHIDQRVTNRSHHNTYVLNGFGNFNIHYGHVYTTNGKEPEKVQLNRCQPPSGLFVGREAIILDLERYFFSNQNQQHVYVLHGIGGTGKSQIAFFFADKAFYSLEPPERRFSQVYYVDASNLITIEVSFKHIAAAEGLSIDSRTVIRWLSHIKSNWLLFFDNADDTSLNLRDYFPPCTHGNILITSRAHASHLYGEGSASHCAVPVLDETESTTLLRRAARVDVNQPFSDANATALVEKLGRLPLAIVQAGSYMAEMTCTIAEYLTILDNTPESLLRSYKQTAAEYQWPVYATWDLNYRQLVAQYPVSAKMLEILSFMHHQGILIEMFKAAFENIWAFMDASDVEDVEEGDQQALDSIRQLFEAFQSSPDEDWIWNSQLFFQVISKIRAFSLLDRNPITHAYSMHPLVHEWGQTVCVSETKTCTLLLLAAAVKFDFDSDGFALRDALLPHLNEVWKSGQHVHSAIAEPFELVYYQGGRWDDAEELEKHVFDVRATMLGLDAPDTLVSAYNLSSIYDQQARYTEAIALLARTTELQRKGHGAEDDQTLDGSILLGTLYRKVGRWSEADELLTTTLDSFIERHGKAEALKNPDILTLMAHLGRVRQAQGQWKEAARLGLETYEARKIVLGENHPYTLISANDYAVVLNSLGHFSSARSLLLFVEEHSKRLGKDHPDALTTRSNIALTYRKEDVNPEAVERIQSEVLIARRRVLGEDHPETLITKGMLVWAYRKLGRLDEAAKLALEIVETRSKPEVLGPEHPDTMTAMHNLADVYVAQGPAGYDKAEQLFKTVMKVEGRTMDDSHPDKWTTLNSLAGLHCHQGRLQEAKDLFEVVLERRRTILGDLHWETLETISWLADVYREMGETAQADQLDLELEEADAINEGSENSEADSES